MLDKTTIKFITSLKQKKYREENKLFIVEGTKMVKEVLYSTFDIKMLVATKEWLLSINKQWLKCVDEVFEAEEDEMSRISSLKNHQNVLAVVIKPEYSIDKSYILEELSLVLDDIKDPGNLGTIMRIADWFGIQTILCSHNTVDMYNPKVVQATMGAIFRIRVHYVDLQELLEEFAGIENFPIYGTFLEGETIYTRDLTDVGFIILGNESKGISESLLPLIGERLFIPSFPLDRQTSESLNVSVAASIVCSEFRRRNL